MAAVVDVDDDDPVLAASLEVHRELYKFVDMSTVVGMSADDTQALGLGRDGFTYGETALGAVWKIMRSVDVRVRNDSNTCSDHSLCSFRAMFIDTRLHSSLRSTAGA